MANQKLSAIISSLTTSTYDWLRESGDLEAADNWMASILKNASDHRKGT